MKLPVKIAYFNYAGEFNEKIDWIYFHLPKPASMNILNSLYARKTFSISSK